MKPNEKKRARLRRARKTRAKIRRLGEYRLTVYRSPRHIYAQIFTPDGSQVVAAASTVEKEVREQLESTGNVDAAAKVGELIAVRAKEKGIDRVAFDRAGFLYHGRVKRLAEAARENGLKF